MTRTRTTVLAIVLAVVALWNVPAVLGQEEPLPSDRPPIVVEDDVAEAGEAAADQAWTFRFLVPTLLAMAGLAIVATVVIYGVRVRGRYRVVR